MEYWVIEYRFVTEDRWRSYSYQGDGSLNGAIEKYLDRMAHEYRDFSAEVSNYYKSHICWQLRNLHSDEIIPIETIL